MSVAEHDQWQAWLSAHGPALLLFARQWLANRQEAEDALQDGFIRFWHKRQQASDPLAYLYACVRSAALDLRRQRQRLEIRHRQAVTDPPPSLTCPPELEERRQAVEEALSHLPEDQRAVLVLKIWGDLTFGQIAATLAISPNTAASRYRYALQHLETRLAREVNCE